MVSTVGGNGVEKRAFRPRGYLFDSSSLQSWTVIRLCTCLGVEHQNVGPRPEQFLRVFVVADLLD